MLKLRFKNTFTEETYWQILVKLIFPLFHSIVPVWEFLIFPSLFGTCLVFILLILFRVLFILLCEIFFTSNLFDVPHASWSLIDSFFLLGEFYSLILMKIFPVLWLVFLFLLLFLLLYVFGHFRKSRISWIFCALNFSDLTLSLTVLSTFFYLVLITWDSLFNLLLSWWDSSLRFLFKFLNFTFSV